MSSLNLADVFVGLANRWGDRTAIVSPDLTLTYSELVARAARSARELRERGIRPGNNIGIASRDGGEMIVLMVAAWMLDATPVPVDFRTKPDELRMLAQQFDLAGILWDRRSPDDFDYQSILVDESWTDVIGRHDGSPLHRDGEAAAIIALTSGTTGRPVGIVYDHARFLLALLCGPETGRVLPGGSMVNPVSLVYLGSRSRTFSHLVGGGTVLLKPPLIGAAEFAEAILAAKATQAYSVPPITRELLKLFGERSKPVFGDLRVLYCAGAPSTPAEKQLARACLSEHYLDYYGATICGAISSLYGEDLDARPDSVGRPLPNVYLQIVDEDDEPLPAGGAGIIRLRTPAMANGVYGEAARASGDRLKDGWAYTGDIGSLDRDGFLTLLGRTSDLIIRSGVNVHPEEVEAALAEHPGVRDVAVVGISAPREGEEIAAFVVAAEGVTESVLVAHSRTRLTHDKRPRKFVFVSELPRNPNGKVLRKQLRQSLQD